MEVVVLSHAEVRELLPTDECTDIACLGKGH
jgi:hypothetical protein